MIEVVLHDHQSGKVLARAETDTPEDAIFAARTLADDETSIAQGAGSALFLRASFYVQGRCVRYGVRLQSLTVSS